MVSSLLLELHLQLFAVELPRLKGRASVSSVISQKSESQNLGNKKTKNAKFFEKHFSPPDTHAYMGKLDKVAKKGASWI